MTTLLYTKKFLSLVLIGGIFFLVGCTKTSPITTTDIPTTTTTTPTTGDIAIEQTIPQRNTYESKTDAFLIQYPGDRTFQENVFGSAVMFFTPVLSGDTLKENVGVMKKTLTKDYTLDEYYTNTKPELIKLIPGFTEVSNTTIQVNGMDAKKLIYIGTQGDKKLKWEQIYLINNKAVYTITYTATESTFSTFAQKIDEMAATLEIK